jgi:hypothetical protein
MKNAKARKPAAVKLTWKLLIISGTIGPKIFVNSEMRKKVRKTRLTA